MIIPIRCMSCGKVLADLYDYYTSKVSELQKKMDESTKKPTKKQIEENFELRHFDKLRTGPILDQLGLTLYCCRRHMIATVDMMDTI